MIKNKDGSYNRFSLLIISLIGIIGIGIIGSTLISGSQDIDPISIAYIGLIISGGLTIYYGKKVFFKSKPDMTRVEHISSMTPIKMDIREVPHFTVEEDPIKIKKPIRKSGFEISGITTLIITIFVGAVALIIGTVVANSMLQALPTLPQNSPMSTSMTSAIESVNIAFNILAMGLVVGAAIMIIGMMSRIFSND